jgi:SMC interacting uncharacterized protein involved in chromosome segregation
MKETEVNIMENLKPVTYTDEEVQNMISRLKVNFEQSVKSFKVKVGQKERYQDLMKRKSAEKWEPAKIAKMVRRLTKVDEEIERVELNLEKLRDSLSKHGIEVDVVRKH